MLGRKAKTCRSLAFEYRKAANFVVLESTVNTELITMSTQVSQVNAKMIFKSSPVSNIAKPEINARLKLE